MILSELIERIKFVAIGAGEGPANPRLLDSEVLIELVLPRCFQRVCEETTLDENRLKDLLDTHTIDVVAGVGTLPENLLVKWSRAISVVFPSKSASLISSYMQYAMTADSIVDTFCIQGRDFLYREDNSAINDYTGSVTLYGVTVPTLPASVSSTVVAPDYILEQVISLAAAVVNGQLPLTKIILDRLDARA